MDARIYGKGGSSSLRRVRIALHVRTSIGGSAGWREDGEKSVGHGNLASGDASCGGVVGLYHPLGCWNTLICGGMY